MSKGKIAAVIAASAAVVAGAVITAVLLLGGSEELFRVLKVFELTGHADVDRISAGHLDAYVGMNLENGDTVSVDSESSVRISLDGDKYILVDENSVIKLTASGSAADSLTRIELTEGTILNEITKPLSGNSVYEISTPKATMAVRGTSFAISVKKEGSDFITDLNVLHGKVAVQLIDESDNPKGSVVYAAENQHVTIKTDNNPSSQNSAEIDGNSYFVISDSSGEYVPCTVNNVVNEIDYSTLPKTILMQAIATNDDSELVLEDDIAEMIRSSLGDETEASENDIPETTTEAVTTVTHAATETPYAATQNTEITTSEPEFTTVYTSATTVPLSETVTSPETAVTTAAPETTTAETVNTTTAQETAASSETTQKTTTAASEEETTTAEETTAEETTAEETTTETTAEETTEETKETEPDPAVPSVVPTISTSELSSASVYTDSSVAYTGSSLTPSVSVYMGSTLLTEGVDYTVSYKNNINVGTGTVIITGIGSYSGTVSKTFEITATKDLSGAVIELPAASFTYNGDDVIPDITVTLGGVPLSFIDYDISFSNNFNAGTATVTITGKGEYTGTKSKNFTIEKLNLSAPGVTVSVNPPSVKYDGTAKEPTVTVTYNGNLLSEGSDYTVSYMNNINASTTAAVIVTGVNNCSNQNSAYFEITKSTPDIGTVALATTAPVTPTTSYTSVNLSRTDTSIPGTLSLVSEVFTVGTKNYVWEFTPTDTTNYESAFGTISITVISSTI